MNRTTTKSHEPTNLEKAYRLLGDGQWHSTKELARRVGHSFAGTLYVIRHRDHNHIESRRHPRRPTQWQYRLTN